MTAGWHRRNRKTPPSGGLVLPARSARPRSKGLTMVIDNGLPLHAFEDAIESGADYIDCVKFGWGTALVTSSLGDKIAWLNGLGIDFYFGGTLFEKYVAQGRFDAYLELCRHHSCRLVEVSNGTFPMTNHEKAAYIRRAVRAGFSVLSEVGYKDAERCLELSASDWSRAIAEDLDAGAERVIAEARESGRSGICRSDGSVRYDVLERILAGGTDPNRLVFEAPTKELQAYFVRRLGAEVNLANVAPADVVGCETLRLGLRSDTFMHFELERAQKEAVASGA